MQCLAQSCIWQNYNKTFATILDKIRKFLENLYWTCWKVRVALLRQVCFQVVDENYMPLLCRSSSENMGLIQQIKAVESDEGTRFIMCLTSTYF